MAMIPNMTTGAAKPTSRTIAADMTMNPTTMMLASGTTVALYLLDC